jgi:dolichol-phosphate mannosyltransferase
MSNEAVPSPPAVVRPASLPAVPDDTRALHHRVRSGLRHSHNWVQLVRFAVVGASGYIINLAVFAACVHAIGLNYRIAAVAAFVVAVTNNFWWNRHWTFAAGDGHAGFQAARFFVVSLGALLVNLIVLELLVATAGFPELPAQAIAVLSAVPLNFVGNKLWSFRA